MSAVVAFPVDRWSGPFDGELTARAIGALEAGRVVFLPDLPFALNDDERSLLTAAAGDGRHKNISLDPASGRCGGAEGSDDQIGRLTAVMGRFADQAFELTASLLPGYRAGLERGRTSFRPAQIANRPMPWRADDRRLHVDAFPSRPLWGRRILRLFANVNPTGQPRRWHVGEPFEDYAQRFLPRVKSPLPGSAALLQWLGITKGRRSRYDALMLGLHDAAKRDSAYQAEAPREIFDFSAGTSWLVYTDAVPHAAVSGQFVFEQTLYVDPAVMAAPERAPVAVLQRMTAPRARLT